MGGNIDLTTQCPIDHIRSGSRRIYNNNETTDEEELYYYTPLEEENNNYNDENNIYLLPEEDIYDPSVGNIRS